MDKCFTIFLTWLEQKEYKKILMSILILFSLIAPSMFIIFLYEKNLFFESDMFRLIIVCLILNIMVFMILFILFSIYMHLENKQIKMKILLKLNEIKPEIQELKNNNKYKEIDSKLIDLEDKYSKKLNALEDSNDVIIKTSIYITYSIILIWLNYYFDIFKDYSIVIFFLVFMLPLAEIFFTLFKLFSLYVKSFLIEIINGNFKLSNLHVKVKDFLIQKINGKFIIKFISYRFVELFVCIFLYFLIKYTLNIIY